MEMVGDFTYTYHLKLCKERGWGWFAGLGVLLGFGYKYAKEDNRTLDEITAYI